MIYGHHWKDNYVSNISRTIILDLWLSHWIQSVFFIDGTSMIHFCFFVARNIQPCFIITWTVNIVILISQLNMNSVEFSPEILIAELGVVLDCGAGAERAIRAKIGAASRKGREISSLLENRGIPLPQHRKVYEACIRSVMLYGGETWALTGWLTSILLGCDRKMLRYMAGVTWSVVMHSQKKHVFFKIKNRFF